MSGDRRHADRTARDHALRETVMHVGRQIDNFTANTWYEKLDPGEANAREGLMDLSEIPLPPDIQVFPCGPLPFMRPRVAAGPQHSRHPRLRSRSLSSVQDGEDVLTRPARTAPSGSHVPAPVPAGFVRETRAACCLHAATPNFTLSKIIFCGPGSYSGPAQYA